MKLKARKHKHRQQHLRWNSGLSDRVCKILNSAKITSRQEVKKLLGKGDYDAYLNSYLGGLRHFGWKAWQELCVWSGLPCPNRPESVYHRWSCTWFNSRGETGHSCGGLEALMHKALRHHAVSISFVLEPQPQNLENGQAYHSRPHGRSVPQTSRRFRRSEAIDRNEARRLLDLLTPREFEVMQLVITGMLNKQIGRELGAAEKTVKVHRGRLMQKLGITSVAELMQLVQKAGLPQTYD